MRGLYQDAVTAHTSGPSFPVNRNSGAVAVDARCCYSPFPTATITMEQ